MHPYNPPGKGLLGKDCPHNKITPFSGLFIQTLPNAEDRKRRWLGKKVRLDFERLFQIC